MLYTLTMLLWAFFAASLTSPAEPDAPLSKTEFQTIIKGDTSVFRELQNLLDHRQKSCAPEKLYLHIDRTLYQPGETAWFSAYIRNADDLMPSIQSQIIYVDLIDPRGTVTEHLTLLALNGKAAGEFEFSNDLPGGLYKIKAWTRWMQNTEDIFERTINLQRVVLPNLNLKLEFERKAVGPGDVAIARLDAFSLDNKALANKEIRFSAAIAGRQFFAGAAQTDANGRAYARFTLPEKIETADGLLNVQIEHNDRTESISRPIPIVLNKIDLAFFPEGGDAVNGQPCRMAFKAVNEFGKPADVEGEILDGNGATVAQFSSYHNGMGAFEFKPKAGERYEARLSEPFASSYPYPLPEIQKSGYSLRLQNKEADQLTFEVSSSRLGKVYLAGQSRDKIFFFKELNFETNVAGKVIVPVADLPVGIARFTLFDGNKTEQAERLVFLHRDRGLKVEFKTGKTEYLPREKVRMDIRVSDHLGRPVIGNFSLAVADENQLVFADDKQGHLLSSLLLEQDVKGKIEEPNFYFDPSEPKSEQALDYLLMTQGWRRFSWKEVLKNKPVAYTHAPERACLEGVVRWQNNKPASGTQISLEPRGPSVVTDQDGHFEFRDFDIQPFSHLIYGQNESFSLQGYGSGLVLKSKAQPAPREINFYTAPGTEGSAVLQGKITDENGDALSGATVKVFKGHDIVRGTIADYDGNYRIRPIDPGVYDLEFCYTGFSSKKMQGVRLASGKITYSDITMKSSSQLDEVNIVAYKVPLIEQDKTQSGQTLSADQIRKLPTSRVNAIVATTAGTTEIRGDDVSIKGSRAAGNEIYLDGVRVADAASPLEDIEQLEVVTGNLGAEFGQIPGGVVNMQGGPADDFEAPGIDTKVREAAKDQKESKMTWADFTPEPAPFASRSAKMEAEKKKAAPPVRPARPVFHRARSFYVPAYETQQATSRRTDFRPTIYWNPNVTTNSNGEARVEFYTSDAVTNFRMSLEGIGANGEPCHAESKFFVQKPLSIAVKVPTEVVAGDILKLQVAVSNKTKYASGGVLNLEVPPHFQPAAGAASEIRVELEAGETRSYSVEYRIGKPAAGSQNLRIRLSADENVLDDFETAIRTSDTGFPVRQVASGASAQNAFNIHLNEPVEGSLSVTLSAYPSALEELLKGMERMLRQPSGCFEQVSSSNYPNLLVLDLLRTTGAAKPDVESRAMQLLEDGYKKLTAYECKSGGFDWWGRDPAHEGLTAYGLLEFTDMSKVFKVDKKMMDRTMQWMLSRRDGRGGWQVNQQSLHGWQGDHVLNAYLAWAVAEAGYGKEFAAEINFACEQALRSDDPYQHALLANALYYTKDARAAILISQLREKQQDDGSWTGNSHSVMYASGDCFRIETTALATLALMKWGEKTVALQKAMDYLTRSKTEYGYGSTQSTVTALKALVEYSKLNKTNAADGMMVVMVDGRRVIEQPFSTNQAKRIEIKNLEQYFTNNDPRMEVFFENSKAVIPFDIEVKYASKLPKNTPNCPISFQTKMSAQTAKVGETVRLSATLKNEKQEAQASPMIVLGIPAGLTLQPWQLKKLVDEKQCDFYELWDGFVVFHFESLPAGASRTLHLDLRADVAGTFEAPASQAFLYYSNDQRVWSKPEKLNIGE